MRANRYLLVLMSAVLLVLLHPAAGVSFEPAEMRFDTGATVVTPGGRPEDVKFAEVNGAGGDDLVAVTNTPDALLVYEGDSSSLFTPLVNRDLRSVVSGRLMTAGFPKACALPRTTPSPRTSRRCGSAAPFPGADVGTYA